MKYQENQSSHNKDNNIRSSISLENDELRELASDIEENINLAEGNKNILSLQEIDSLINDIFAEETVSAYSISEEDSNKYREQNIITIYGELTPFGVDTIIRNIEVTDMDSFADLGSGTGKVCLQFLLGTPLKEVYAVEGTELRHEIAVRAFERAKAISPRILPKDRDIHYVLDNFWNFDFNSVTILLLCSTCFSDDMMKKLSSRISSSSSIHTVLTLKKFDELPGFELEKSINIKTSWSDDSIIYVYSIGNHKN